MALALERTPPLSVRREVRSDFLSMESNGIEWPCGTNQITSMDGRDTTRLAIGRILRAHAWHWFAYHHKTARLSRASQLGCCRHRDLPDCDSEPVRRSTRLNQTVSHRIVRRVCSIAVWSSSFRFCTTSKPHHRSLEGAMLIARSFGDIKRFQSAASHLLAALRP
jgi:hypothetical protein